MLSSISWEAYLEVMIVILVIYYFFILLLYYRMDIRTISKNGFKKQGSTNPGESGKLSSYAVSDVASNENDPVLFSAVHDLLEELKEIFSAASDKHFLKQELIVALQIKLRNYQQLKDTPFQMAVNNHVIQQSIEHLDIYLDDFEIKQIW